MNFVDQVAIIFAATKGHLDTFRATRSWLGKRNSSVISVNKPPRFATEILKEKKLTPDLTKGLKRRSRSSPSSFVPNR